MKIVYFIRHAKAVHDGTADFDRGLEERGFSDARLMSEHLKEKNVKFDKIISSPSKRTMMTAQIFAQVLGHGKKIKAVKELYASSPGRIISVLNDVKDKHDCVAIVGHNEEITEVCGLLSDETLGHMPTSGVCALSFNTASWADVEIGSGKMIYFNSPKRVKKYKKHWEF